MTATVTLPPWATQPMTEAELDALVQDDESDEPQRPWAINSTGEAEWAMAKLAAVEAQLEAIHNQEVEWRNQLETWLADAIRQPMARHFFFVGALVDYQRRLRAADPKAKSLKLPSGVVKSTSTPEHAAVLDEEALVEWALEHAPNEVETSHRVPAKNLKSMAEIVEEVVIERWLVELACGHRLFLSVGPEQPPEKGEITYCPACPLSDARTLKLPTSAVVSVVADNVTRKVVRHCETGQELPGVAVEPESLSIKVKPAVTS